MPAAIIEVLLIVGEVIIARALISTGIAQPAPRIAAESPQQARSASVVRARTCSVEPEFGAQII
jgi:hypothetical protein